MRYSCKDYVFEWFDMTKSILVRILILSRNTFLDTFFEFEWTRGNAADDSFSSIIVNKNLILIWLALVFLLDVWFLSAAKKSIFQRKFKFLKLNSHFIYACRGVSINRFVKYVFGIKLALVTTTQLMFWRHPSFDVKIS